MDAKSLVEIVMECREGQRSGGPCRTGFEEAEPQAERGRVEGERNEVEERNLKARMLALLFFITESPPQGKEEVSVHGT
ncbi:MAG: hypothetical protein QFX33_02120 [Candidatus Nezhaarchaeota archaeon]|nr:hypothetical protein [Candidatus Nezhaarchaeota archaeon]